MLKLYITQNNSLIALTAEEISANIEKLVWIDLLYPTQEEEHFVEKILSTSIPTRDEMHDIELSSRLYQENGKIYTTATILTQADTPEPEEHAITFVLSGNCLITVRYSEPKSFKLFLARSSIADFETYNGNSALAVLMETTIDRMADLLANVGHDIDYMSKKIFRPHLKGADARAKEKPDLDEMLRQVGIKEDLISKIKESMISIHRLLGYVSQTAYFKISSEENNRVQSIIRDVQALDDHATFLSDKLSFILDAILGMISIEQNAIIKIFSVASVVFLPPTLVASIYGMNFEFMPELKLHYGYPIAIILMILSAYLPFRFFKKKGWL